MFYDKLLDEGPEILQRMACAEVEGKTEVIIAFVQHRFPALAEYTQKQVEPIQDSQKLTLLFRKIIVANDEAGAREALSMFVA